MGGTKDSMNKKMNRGEAVLERVMAKTGLTNAGKEWLIGVLDPMHDRKLEIEGYPDREVGPSIVQVVKQSVTISCPPAFGANPWGFHVRMDDTMCHNNDATNNGGVSQGFNYVDQDLAGSSPGNLAIGGLNVTSFQDGSSGAGYTCLYILGATGDQNVKAAQLNVPPKYLNGKTRVLGQAFEVVNTTPQLYRGGACCTYEMPESKSGVSTWNFIGSNTVSEADTNEKKRLSLPVKGPETFIIAKGVKSMCFKNLPPLAQSDALLLPGSQQWDAELGCYVVQTMNDMENPPAFLDDAGAFYCLAQYACQQVDVTVTAIAPSVYYQPGIPINHTAGSQLADVLTWPVQKTIPFNQKGAIFSGLDSHSTFVLNFNTIVERFVNQQDVDLVVLAKPSPCEDYIATQLYSEICRALPVATKFSDNDLGEWFLGCVDEIASVVSSIGRPIVNMANDYQRGRKGLPVRQEPAGTYANNAKTLVVRSKPLPPIPNKKKKPTPPPKPKHMKGKPIPPPKPKKK